MGLDGSLLVSAAYLILTLAVLVAEYRRTLEGGPDLITVFIVLFVLQCCLPGIIIYPCLALADANSPTGILAFDRIFTFIDSTAAWLVFALTGGFIAFFYLFASMCRSALVRLVGQPSSESRFVLSGSAVGLTIILVCGALFSFVSFYLMGGSFLERYTNLILLRGGADGAEPSLLNLFSFALSQTWEWLCIPALFAIHERYGRNRLWFLCAILLIGFAILGVSRRALFIPILLTYLTFVLFDGRWRVGWLVGASIPILVLIAFGKELLGVIGFGASLADVTDRYDTIAATLLRAASDIGITVVESLGTINLLDLPARYGVDHLLSVFRQIPTSHAWLGELPVRVVRLSTAAFAGPDDEDIPPGLFGQMWLDFRVLGPIAWAFALSVQMCILQFLYSRTIRTRQATALFVLVTFVVALPLNSGTYDFSFRMDIYALVLCVLITFRLIRVRVAWSDYEANASAAASRN